MTFAIVYDNYTWMIIDPGSSNSSVFNLSLNVEIPTSPLLVTKNENTASAIAPGQKVVIAPGQTVAIDEKFKVKLTYQANASKLSVFVNEEKITVEEFNKRFSVGASEVDNQGFGMYSIVVEDQNGKFPPLLLERYPGYKIGYDFCGKKEQCPVKRYFDAVNFFKTMTDSLRDSDLALSLLDPASFAPATGEGASALGTDRKKTHPRTELTDYWFFKKHAETIQKSLRHIRRIPHKVLGHDKEYLRIENVTRYAPDLPYEISKAPQYFQKSESIGICTKNGNTYAPEKVLVSILEETFDNPENRFLLHIIDIFLTKLRKVEEYLPKEKKNKEISSLIKALKMFKGHPDFREIQRNPVEPKQSKVLTKTPGYRDIAEIWRQYGGLELNEGLQFLEGLVRQKKWHELYELWCFQLLIEKLGVEGKAKYRTGYHEKKDGQHPTSPYLTSTVEFKKNNDSYILLYQPTINNNNECTFKKTDGNEANVRLSEGEGGEIRPDFLLLKVGKNDTYELCCLLDAKFMVSGDIPDRDYCNQDEESVNEKSEKDFFKKTVLDIEKKYLKRFSRKIGEKAEPASGLAANKIHEEKNAYYKLPGCGIFLDGTIQTRRSRLENIDTNVIRDCISVATVNSSGNIVFGCDKGCGKEICNFKIPDIF